MTFNKAVEQFRITNPKRQELEKQLKLLHDEDREARELLRERIRTLLEGITTEEYHIPDYEKYKDKICLTSAPYLNRRGIRLSEGVLDSDESYYFYPRNIGNIVDITDDSVIFEGEGDYMGQVQNFSIKLEYLTDEKLASFFWYTKHCIAKLGGYNREIG